MDGRGSAASTLPLQRQDSHGQYMGGCGHMPIKPYLQKQAASSTRGLRLHLANPWRTPSSSVCLGRLIEVFSRTECRPFALESPGCLSRRLFGWCSSPRMSEWRWVSGLGICTDPLDGRALRVSDVPSPLWTLLGRGWGQALRTLCIPIGSVFLSQPSTTLSSYYLQLREFFIYTALETVYPCWANIRFL